MMSYEQLERYFRLLEVISGYEKILAKSEIGLSASRPDAMPRSGEYRSDRMTESIIRREEAQEKLRRLKALAAAQAPEVEATIVRAAGGGRAAVKAELILRARYQSGRSWEEIADILHEKNAGQIRNFIIQRLEKAEERGYPASAGHINAGLSGSPGREAARKP